MYLVAGRLSSAGVNLICGMKKHQWAEICREADRYLKHDKTKAWPHDYTVQSIAEGFEENMVKCCNRVEVDQVLQIPKANVCSKFNPARVSESSNRGRVC